MKYPTDKFGDTPAFITNFITFLSITVLIGLTSLFIFSLWMPSSNAFWWNDDPLEKLTGNFNDAVSGLLTSERKLRQDQRRLFNDHCDLIELKIDKGLPINEKSYITPCRDGDQSEYFKIRSELNTRVLEPRAGK